jgi:hypothetical protein
MMAEAQEAAGDALASMATSPGIAMLTPLVGLLKADPPCDWSADVLPAVSSAAAWHRSRAGPGSMTSWTVAVRIARENRDRRLAPEPVTAQPESRTDARPHPVDGQPDPKLSARQDNYGRALAGALAATRLRAAG